MLHSHMYVDNLIYIFWSKPELAIVFPFYQKPQIAAPSSPFPPSSFLGSGPEGADDLCFHIGGNFSLLGSGPEGDKVL